MSDPQDLERDLLEYLAKEPNLRREDRASYLRTLFHKHFEINKLEHVVNYYDVQEMIGFAKNHNINMKLPCFITRKKITPTDAPMVAMIEAVISYFTRAKILRKEIKVDYTE